MQKKISFLVLLLSTSISLIGGDEMRLFMMKQKSLESAGKSASQADQDILKKIKLKKESKSRSRLKNQKNAARRNSYLKFSRLRDPRNGAKPKYVSKFYNKGSYGYKVYSHDDGVVHVVIRARIFYEGGGIGGHHYINPEYVKVPYRGYVPLDTSLCCYDSDFNKILGSLVESNREYPYTKYKKCFDTEAQKIFDRKLKRNKKGLGN